MDAWTRNIRLTTPWLQGEQDAVVASVLAAGEAADRLAAARAAAHPLDLEHPARTAAHREREARRSPERYGASPAAYGVLAHERGHWDRLRAAGFTPSEAARVVVRARQNNTGGTA